MQTPWGESDSIEIIAPGVYLVTTPSHGGIKVETPILDRIPYEYKVVSFGGLGFHGWFEEDGDWCIPVLALPDLFTGDRWKDAERTFDYWIRPKLETRARLNTELEQMA
jgi:hypothetical protein